jgi:hypothetical protein
MSDPLFTVADLPFAQDRVEPPGPGWCERDVLGLLRQRYTRVVHGNGVRYVYAHHVRSHAGSDARRTADFVAMDLWPSKGLCLHGHEVKVSRADWLTELKHPEKAGEFLPYMDYWWLVVADARIVRRGELPDGWGLVAPGRNGLVVKRQARRREASPMPKTMPAAFVRAVAKSAAAGGSA